MTKFLQQIFGYIYEQKIEEPMQRIQDIANEGNAKAQAIIGMFHVSWNCLLNPLLNEGF